MAPTRALLVPASAAPRACYIHLPFCRRRCYYCDFPIQVVGDKPGAADAAAEQYVGLLLREMRASPRAAEGVGTAPLRSVYFGGGTPSLTPPALLAAILSELRSTHGVEEHAEVTLEMDPGTFDADRLARYIDCGVSRVSLGVQSFDAELLTKAGRAHSLQDVHQALALLDSAPRRLQVSIDLISGLPFQTMDSWTQSLAAASQFSHVGHVSVYDLQVEQGTAFGRWYKSGAAPLPTEGSAADMFRAASSSLRAAGFDHYEVSSYARPGQRCAHNRAYWSNQPFWGWVDRLESRGWAAAAVDGATLEAAGSMDELQTKLMLGLRTDQGVTLSELEHPDQLPGLAAAAFGACMRVAEAHPLWAAVQGGGGAGARGFASGMGSRPVPQVEGGAGLGATATGGEGSAVGCASGGGAGGAPGDTVEPRVVLSDPEGLLFSNEVISSVFAEMERRAELILPTK